MNEYLYLRAVENKSSKTDLPKKKKNWLVVPQTGLNTKSKFLLKLKLWGLFFMSQPQKTNTPKENI